MVWFVYMEKNADRVGHPRSRLDLHAFVHARARRLRSRRAQPLRRQDDGRDADPHAHHAAPVGQRLHHSAPAGRDAHGVAGPDTAPVDRIGVVLRARAYA